MKLSYWCERIELPTCTGSGFRQFGEPVYHCYADGKEITVDEFNDLLMPPNVVHAAQALQLPRPRFPL